LTGGRYLDVNHVVKANLYLADCRCYQIEVAIFTKSILLLAGQFRQTFLKIHFVKKKKKIQKFHLLSLVFVDQ